MDQLLTVLWMALVASVADRQAVVPDMESAAWPAAAAAAQLAVVAWPAVVPNMESAAWPAVVPNMESAAWPAAAAAAQLAVVAWPAVVPNMESAAWPAAAAAAQLAVVAWPVAWLAGPSMPAVALMMAWSGAGKNLWETRFAWLQVEQRTK